MQLGLGAGLAAAYNTPNLPFMRPGPMTPVAVAMAVRLEHEADRGAPLRFARVCGTPNARLN